MEGDRRGECHSNRDDSHRNFDTLDDPDYVFARGDYNGGLLTDGGGGRREPAVYMHDFGGSAASRIVRHTGIDGMRYSWHSDRLRCGELHDHSSGRYAGRKQRAFQRLTGTNDSGRISNHDFASKFGEWCIERRLLHGRICSERGNSALQLGSSFGKPALRHVAIFGGCLEWNADNRGNVQLYDPGYRRKHDHCPE
jgi:hypothetical protein